MEQETRKEGNWFQQAAPGTPELKLLADEGRTLPEAFERQDSPPPPPCALRGSWGPRGSRNFPNTGGGRMAAVPIPGRSPDSQRSTHLLLRLLPQLWASAGLESNEPRPLP